jgi:hypothetical protein
MSSAKVPVNRMLVGVLAVGCVVAGFGIALLDTWENAVFAGLLRTGVLLGAVWLALPTKSRQAAWANISPWTLLGFLIVAVIAIRRPQIFFPMVAVFVVATLLIRPRRRA